MKLAILPNSCLDEPYCYTGLDELGQWHGVSEEYIPGQEIDAYLACDEQGRIWLWDAERQVIMDAPPLDENQPFECWARDPSAIIIEI